MNVNTEKYTAICTTAKLFFFHTCVFILFLIIFFGNKYKSCKCAVSKPLINYQHRVSYEFDTLFMFLFIFTVCGLLWGLSLHCTHKIDFMDLVWRMQMIRQFLIMYFIYKRITMNTCFALGMIQIISIHILFSNGPRTKHIESLILSRNISINAKLNRK